MLRYTFVLAGLLSLTGLSAGGCRSCSSCHDYDPPVAKCQCGGCGAPCAGGTQCACGGNNANGPYAEAGSAPQGNVNGGNDSKPQNDQQKRTNQPATANASPGQ